MDEKKLLTSLKGFIKGKTASSCIITSDKFEAICREALKKAKKQYKPKDKISFYGFLTQKAEEIIHGELAIEAQKGNQKAFQELFILIDRPLSRYIASKMRCSKEESMNYAEQTWDRWIRAEEFQLSLYDNKEMEQSFFQYLKNKANTIIRHVHKEIISKNHEDGKYIYIIDELGHEETPETLLTAKEEIIERKKTSKKDLDEYKKVVLSQPEIILELFQLALFCKANKPHQILAFGFKLMHWKPLKTINELSKLILEDIGKKLCEDLYIFTGQLLDRETYRINYFSLLEEQFAIVVDVMYSESEYASIRRAYKNHRTGLVHFQSFYGKNKSASISNWTNRVKQRARNPLINKLINNGS